MPDRERPWLKRCIAIGLLTMLMMVAIRIDAADPNTPNPIHPEMFRRSGLDCSVCHSCDSPSRKDPCLLNCPRVIKGPDKDLATSPDNGPDMVIIDSLEHFFNPTRFDHKKHARMGMMSRGCVDCHHYNPDGNYKACKECHQPRVSTDNIHQVGLNAAYHRRCLGCHREWSKDADCEICHTSKSAAVSDTPMPKTAAPFTSLHSPEKVEFSTEFLGSSKVTFQHDSHSKDRGLQCKDCHKGVGCTPCHDQKSIQKPAAHAVTVPCLDCHKSENCESCHIPVPDAKPFDHSQTRFPLRAFHQNLNCRKCHSNPERHHSAPSDCEKCHEERWLKDHFKHEMIGLKLDDVHMELECTECHAKSNYLAHPQCKSCHGPELAYPGKAPGQKLGK